MICSMSAADDLPPQDPRAVLLLSAMPRARPAEEWTMSQLWKRFGLALSSQRVELRANTHAPRESETEE